jgi:hypothetical protein
MSSSLIKLNADVNAATLVMDSQKENGPYIAWVRLGPRQPGRAVLVAADTHEAQHADAVGGELLADPARPHRSPERRVHTFHE